MSKPTIVIIPGSFSVPAQYEGLAEQLRSYGFETIVGPLQSAGRRDPLPAATMQDDAAYFSEVITNLANEGKEIVLLPHSYGGVVANESAKGLLKSDRLANGQPGGIIRIVFISSVVPPEGLSTADLAVDLSLDEFITVDGDYMIMKIGDEAIKANFADISPEEALPLAKMYTDHSTKSFADKLTFAAYKYVPVSFIFCERDGTLPPDFQRKTIARIEEASGREVQVLSIDSGHCPAATRPEETAGLVRMAIGQN
ncbi:uncharacterized protein N7459_007472 [Penicillium hispanicum]|uniref:uncharacterized protein n=1 Tax=Penicillium hispanicum TaxID=1080232 RepID=UPI00254143E3|nr:uncharacterized protein N7459_007472 [Penicillium hispanicum]KAJ5578508.1 hypothetical protein N7459_007472 [Penicillium hispanicum]